MIAKLYPMRGSTAQLFCALVIKNLIIPVNSLAYPKTLSDNMQCRRHCTTDRIRKKAMTTSTRNAHINANSDNAIKVNQQNATKGKKQTSKAKTLLEKTAIDAVKNPVPQKPESMIDHQHKAIEAADFIKIGCLDDIDVGDELLITFMLVLVLVLVLTLVS